MPIWYNGFVAWARFPRAMPAMASRRAVILTLSRSSHPTQLLSRQQSAPISPLAATLMDLPASVANKRLTRLLSPLAATLTKNTGVGIPSPDVPTLRRSDVQTLRLSLFCRALHQECFTTLLQSKRSTLFLKTAGCIATIPILKLHAPPASPLIGFPPSHPIESPRYTIQRACTQRNEAIS